MKKIIIFGARGNGTVLTSLIESINEIKIGRFWIYQ